MNEFSFALHMWIDPKATPHQDFAKLVLWTLWATFPSPLVHCHLFGGGLCTLAT